MDIDNEMELYLIVAPRGIENILKYDNIMALSLLQCKFIVIITYFIAIMTVIWWMFHFQIKLIFCFKNSLDKLQIIIPINNYANYDHILYRFVFIHCKKCNIVYHCTNLLYFYALILVIMKFSKIISINIIIIIININIANQEKFGIFCNEKHELYNIQQLMIDYLQSNNDTTIILWLFMLLLYTISIIQSKNISYFQVEKYQTFHCTIWCLPSKNTKNVTKESILKQKRFTFYTLCDVLNQLLLCVSITIISIINCSSILIVICFMDIFYIINDTTVHQQKNRYFFTPKHIRHHSVVETSTSLSQRHTAIIIRFKSSALRSCIRSSCWH